MSQKLFDSELKVMEFIWAYEPISAKDLGILAEKEFSWNKNTTYTVIKKIEAKGYIKRTEPGFICSSLISRADVCKSETRGLRKWEQIIRLRDSLLCGLLLSQPSLYF